MKKHSARHNQGYGFLTIDVHAQRSRLRRINPGLKVGFGVAVLLLCTIGNSPTLSLVVLVGMTGAIVLFGKERLVYVLRLMRLPGFFILLSSLAIVFNVSSRPLGYFDFSFGGLYLSATVESSYRGLAVFLKAYGAVSCLYFLCLTTPMQELIEVMKVIRLPGVVIELMYLIYRYIFILLETQRRMTRAAEARLGFTGAGSIWRTFGLVGGNLLASAFRRVRGCFDAMESRCYDGSLAFYTQKTPLRLRHALLCGAVFCVLLLLAVTLRGKGWDLF